MTRGRATGVVVANGMQTELGKIAGMLASSEAGSTPLQQRLDHLGKILVFISVSICGLVGMIGLNRGEDLRLMFLSAVSLAVAAIPEGLPAIVTIALALGVQRMIKRSVIIRRLPAVETLGCGTVICSDKTGTLTQNQMMVTTCYLSGEEIEVSGHGYDPSGQFIWRGKVIKPSVKDCGFPDAHGLQLLLRAGFYCNNSALVLDSKTNQWELTGDPTEGALHVLGLKAGLKTGEVHRLAEIEFTSERKRMSVLVEEEGNRFLYMKGARFTAQLVDTDPVGGKSHLLQNQERHKLNQVMNKMAGRSLGF